MPLQEVADQFAFEQTQAKQSYTADRQMALEIRREIPTGDMDSQKECKEHKPNSNDFQQVRKILMQQNVSPRVAAAANPAVQGSVPGGAALMMYGLGTNAAGAKPAENIPVSKNKLN